MIGLKKKNSNFRTQCPKVVQMNRKYVLAEGGEIYDVFWNDITYIALLFFCL